MERCLEQGKLRFSRLTAVYLLIFLQFVCLLFGASQNLMGFFLFSIALAAINMLLVPDDAKYSRHLLVFFCLAANLAITAYYRYQP